MRTGNESDLVAEMENTGTDFSSWLHESSNKEMYIQALHQIQAGQMTPAMFRLWLMDAFYAGCRQSLQNLRRDLTS